MLYTYGNGRYQSEYQALWDSLVPDMGQADTVQGELVRVIGRLASEYYRNGRSNWDGGFRKYTNYLYRHLRDAHVFPPETIAQIETDIAAIRAWGSRIRSIPYVDDEDPFDRVTDRVVEWCRRYPTPVPHVHDPKLRR